MFPESIERVSPAEWSKRQLGSTLGLDFECYYSSAYSVSQLGNWAYCKDDRFDAYLVAVTDGRQTCVCTPRDYPWESIDGKELVSHNRDFDRAVWERLRSMAVAVGGIPAGAEPSSWHCSAALCVYHQLPRALAGAVKEVFGVHLDKSVRRHARGRRPAEELFGPSEEDTLYAARDAEAALALWNLLGKNWPQHERRLFELTADMGSRGVCLDWDYVAESRQELEGLIQSLSSALPWSPPLSIKQFRDACESIGVVPPKRTSAHAPEFLQWLERHQGSDAATWLRHMQRIRSANRTAKVLEAMERRRKPDSRSPSAEAPGDRMAYELKYFGASTGRWSGGGGLNLQNLNRKETGGVDLRRAMVAPSGHCLAVIDYSQIESRVLLYLAGDTEALAMFEATPDADAYEIHARATMGYEENEPLKGYCDRTGSNLRQLAKARVLGLGFGCGPKRFIEVAKVMAGLDIGFGESKRIVDAFRESNSRIVSLWRRLNDACASCDGGDYVLPLPCAQANPELKRFLIYRDVSAGEDGIECTVRGERVRVYGGLLAENWTQATARDVLASAWLRCVDAGFRPVLSVHDELVFEVPIETAQADLERITEIMENPLTWAPRLPLRADGKLMDFYQK